jgi:flagellar biosynthesis protein FlhG
VARDQAHSLRQQQQNLKRQNSGSGKKAFKLAITSGKGGVGKTNISLNLAIALGKLGKRVLLVDADPNLANIDILLGINIQNTLADIIAGTAFFSDTIVQGPEGIHILPGSSGVIEMVKNDLETFERMSGAFNELEQQYDILLIDTGAGLSESILNFVVSADEAVLVTNSEPTSITDAYAMVKVATHLNPLLKMNILVNLVPNTLVGKDTFEKLQLAVRNFLQIEIDVLGYLPFDPNVQIAVSEREPFIELFPKSKASVTMMMMAHKVVKMAQGNKARNDGMFERLFQVKDK